MKLTHEPIPVLISCIDIRAGFPSIFPFAGFPAILPFDDMPWISIVRMEKLTSKSEIRILHSDGTYLVKVRGTRAFSTVAGRRIGIDVRIQASRTVCNLNGITLFEINHYPGSFKARAKLYPAKGYFVKSTEGKLPSLLV